MEAMKRLRKMKKLTQTDVANGVGITFQTYSSYETDNTKPTPEMLCKLADYFNVSLDELLGRSSTPEMFDDARVDRPEILELFEQLSPAQQQNLLNYARGMVVANQLEKDEAIVQNKKRA